MQWRGGLLVAVMLLAGCSGSEEGTANTAPIRAENAVATTTVPAPTTAVPVTTTSTTTSVARVDSVPTPVGEDYRVPVVVKFVPTNDAEREVLAAATELIVRQHRNELLFVRDPDLLGQVLYGTALTEYEELLTTIEDSVVVPSAIDRIVVDSLEVSDRTVEAVTCEVDGSTTYDRKDTGEFVLFNDEVATVNKRYVFVRAADGLRISVNETVETTMGVDKCES